MNDRRMKRKAKKQKCMEEIPCIIFLSSDEKDSFDLAEKKENKQLKYINQYADAHGLIPIKIIRRGCMGNYVRDEMFKRCLTSMKNGRAKAILVANMQFISSGVADAYHKVGVVRELGFRIFSVDEGELKLNLIDQGAKAGEKHA